MAGQEGQEGQGGQQGQEGQGGQIGGQNTGGQFGGNQQFGGGPGGGIYNDRRGLGFWDPTSPLTLDPEARAELEERLQEAGRDLLALGTRLRAEGLTVEELEAIRRLGDTLRGGLPGNPELIEQEYLAMLDLVEQLELQLIADELGAEESAVRTQTPAEIAQEYEEAVAEYFRQLSRSERP